MDDKQHSGEDGLSHQLIDAERLGRMLGLGSERSGSAARAIQNRIDRGYPVPPCVSIPGLKKRLWRTPTVLIWIAEYEAPLRKRGGRPSKVDRRAMGRM